MAQAERVTIDDLRRELPAMLREGRPWCPMCLRHVEATVFLGDYGTFVCRVCRNWFACPPTAVFSPAQLREALQEDRCLNCWKETEEWVVLEEIHTGDHLVCCPACADDAPIVEVED
jgi:hypothetical protein